MTQTEEFLAHYGVPGMKWGKRKGSSGSSKSSKEPASADAVAVGALMGKKKKSGTSALSNKELQTVITRRQLEQQYSNLNPGKVAQGQNKVKTVLSVIGTVGAVAAIGSSPLGRAAGKGITTAAKSQAGRNLAREVIRNGGKDGAKLVRTASKYLK